MTAPALQRAIQKGSATASFRVENPSDLDGIADSSLRSLTLKVAVPELPDLNRVKTLQSLKITGKTLERLPALPRSLETLFAAGHCLAELPELSSLKRLEHLDVSDNALTELPSALWGLPMLHVVSATGNQIARVGEEVAAGRKPLFLHLDDNPGIDVRDLGGKKLKSLTLRNCALTHLPLGDLPGLEILSLGSNPLGEVPQVVFTCKKLRWLYLWGCDLTEVPEQIATLRALEILELEKNQLTDLPAKLPPKLKTLFLENNRFTQVPDAVLALKKLEKFNISGNPIPQVPERLATLPKR